MTAPQDLVDLALRLKLATDGAIDLTTQELARAWSQAWDEIAQEWREALMELATMAEDGQWPTRAQIARNVRAQAALQATAEALMHLTEQTQAAVTGDLPALVQMAADHQQSMLTAQLPPAARIPAVAYDPGAVAAMMARTTQQITALSWPLQPEATAAMRAALIRGMAVGDNPRTAAADMLKRLHGVFDGGRTRAENIARTEMVDAYRTAAEEREKLHADVLKGWVWVCALTERSCFPAGTMVETNTGAVPIEEIATGMSVQTHTGRTRQVTELIRRHYTGDMVTIEAPGVGAIVATADHPFLVEREGELQWVEARSVREGDAVLRYCDGSLDDGDHVVGEVSVEAGVWDTHHDVASGLHVQVFSSVPVFRSGVPVEPIYFDNDGVTGE